MNAELTVLLLMLLVLPTIVRGRSEATGSLEEVAEEEADVLSLLAEGSPPSCCDGLLIGDCGADWLDKDWILDSECSDWLTGNEAEDTLLLRFNRAAAAAAAAAAAPLGFGAIKGFGGISVSAIINKSNNNNPLVSFLFLFLSFSFFFFFFFFFLLLLLSLQEIIIYTHGAERLNTRSS